MNQNQGVNIPGMGSASPEYAISEEDGKICIKLPKVDKRPKDIIRKIRNKLIEREEKFDLIVTIQGKDYRLKHPRLIDRLKSIDYKVLYRDVLYRATIVTSSVLLALLILVLFLPLSVKHIDVATGNVINVSGLVSALLITYMISKTLAIRQEKLDRVLRIKELSGRLSAFRNLCHSLVSCPNFFDGAQQEERHARTIGLRIDFNDVQYLNTDDKVRSRYVSELMRYDQYNEPLTKFFLQLHTFCMNRHLTFYYKDAVLMEATSYRNYVYSSKELERWQFLTDNNLFWFVFEHESHEYERFFNFNLPRYNLTLIRKYAAQIEPSSVQSGFNKDSLVHLSQLVGQEVIPELTLAVMKNESGVPRIIRYFITTVTLVFIFGVIIPTFSSLFLPYTSVNLICIMVVLSIVLHIMLCLPTVLKEEMAFHPKYDYI